MGRSQHCTRTLNIRPLIDFSNIAISATSLDRLCSPSAPPLIPIRVSHHFRPPKGPVRPRRAAPTRPATFLIPGHEDKPAMTERCRRSVAHDFTSAAHMSCPQTDQSPAPHSSTHGTIPIEIYLKPALSSASYTLPERRPWDPRRDIWRAERLARRLREDKQRADSQSSYGEFNCLPRPRAPPTRLLPMASSVTTRSTKRVLPPSSHQETKHLRRSRKRTASIPR